MSNGNLGWLFYRGYFKDINWKNIKSQQQTISKRVNNLINTTISIPQEEPLGNICFEAITLYPGLLLGSGYLHELPDIKGQAILGFDFDYTTGLPIIRGSSIKGVLKSAFREPIYIQELLDDNLIDIKKLKVEIFGEDNKNGNKIPGKDIFFDAIVVSKKEKLLEDDYLAPHGDNPFKHPVPLRFIKVAPGVKFRFDFNLKDGLISKEKKLKLFQDIIEDLGVGAKTNVGYGKFKVLKKICKD